jgi:hypothetical protein
MRAVRTIHGMSGLPAKAALAGANHRMEMAIDLVVSTYEEQRGEDDRERGQPIQFR